MASRSLKGITVEIDGSTTGLQSAMKEVNTQIKNTMRPLTKIYHKEGNMTPLTRYEQETIINFNAGEQTDIDKTYSMPRAYVSYRKPGKLSDEQREQVRQRMRSVNSADT